MEPNAEAATPGMGRLPTSSVMVNSLPINNGVFSQSEANHRKLPAPSISIQNLLCTPSGYSTASSVTGD